MTLDLTVLLSFEPCVELVLVFLVKQSLRALRTDLMEYDAFILLSLPSILLFEVLHRSFLSETFMNGPRLTVCSLSVTISTITV